MSIMIAYNSLVIKCGSFLAFIINLRSAIVMFDLEIRLSADNYPNGFPEYLSIRPGSVLTAGTGVSSFTFNFIDEQVLERRCKDVVD